MSPTQIEYNWTQEKGYKDGDKWSGQNPVWLQTTVMISLEKQASISKIATDLSAVSENLSFTLKVSLYK